MFGLSPYQTKFELWHSKRDATLVKFEGNERMAWGTRLQDAIAKGVAEEQNWDIRKMNEYIMNTNLRVGSSFDFSIEDDGERGLGILEIKNVDGLQFKNGWEIDDSGEISAPPHIEMQVQLQMGVSDRKYAYIAALVGGNTLKLIRRERDDDVCFQMFEQIHKFWESIENNIAPSPDFKADAEFISKLYSYAEPNKVIDASGSDELLSLADQYRVCTAQAKAYTEARDSIRAQILMLINDAEKVLGHGFTISAGITGPTIVKEYERKGFRNFRITFKKEK